LVAGTEGCDGDGDEDAWSARLDFAVAQVPDNHNYPERSAHAHLVVKGRSPSNQLRT
jgi:hypothetical protein